MKIDFLTSGDSGQSHRLLLLFGGWGSDSTLAHGLQRDDYHLAVAYDYMSTEPTPADFARIARYGEIIVVAWSYGVAAAALFLAAHPDLPVSLRIAVNGTHTPVDAHTGIAPAIFNGTLSGLSEPTLRKFRLRMCGSADAFKQYCAVQQPDRSLDSLRSELEYLGGITARDVDTALWDVVYISDSDMIIPTAAQQCVWQGHPGVRIVKGSHLPDFRGIIDRDVADKQYLSRRFGRSQSTYDMQAQIQQHVAERLDRMVGPFGQSCGDTLEVGCGSGMLTRRLTSYIDSSHLTLWDIAPIPDGLPGSHRQCDAEAAIRDVASHSFDIIASASTVQWFDSPGRFVDECARVLRPGGVLAIATYGPDTFTSVRPYAVGFAPRYYSVEWWRLHLEPYFDIAELETESHILEFESPIQLARHISLTGVNATRPSAAALRDMIRDDVRRLEYQPVYILAIAKSK
ncbi:MAG: DUF452 family protein [Paramuribaculum sp.]|nr:DUF452 family protein [Paramuribaculum sp.]